MTRDSDIERVLDQFYAEGPAEMPDRVFLGVFDRIERVPQRRLAFLPRFATMNLNVRIAIAAAIVVAVAGFGAFALTNQPDVAAPSTPGPSATATVGAPVPVGLRGRWVGAPRLVPEAPEPPARNALLVTDAQLGFALAGQGLQQQFPSIASLTAPGQLHLVGASKDGGCRPRDEGSYTFTLDSSGTALTITPIADACAPRAAALAGAWTHVGCSEADGWCLGDLAAGTHESVVFTPMVPLKEWQFRYGQLSYAVPAGWRNTADCPWCYVLARQDAPENTYINVWSEAVAHVQADQCSEKAEPGVGRDADSLVTWLTTLPGLVTSNPQAVTIGGLSGKLVDLSLKPTWRASCPYAYSKNLPLVSTFVGSSSDTGFDWNIQGEGRTRIIALDLGDGRALVIDIEAQNQADYDALLPGAMEVVNTFTFAR